jgi:predicted metal-binding transcription factor (methanogenesis marker protein 9)
LAVKLILPVPKEFLTASSLSFAKTFLVFSKSAFRFASFVWCCSILLFNSSNCLSFCSSFSKIYEFDENTS